MIGSIAPVVIIIMILYIFIVIFIRVKLHRFARIMGHCDLANAPDAIRTHILIAWYMPECAIK